MADQEENNTQSEENEDIIHDVRPVSGMYENWFLEYASYVILERAVPAIEDGFKPVQRRIMHSMKEKDDGRFNKVANIIGHTMQYHPHGDAAIGDAIVNLGQKDLLIETQGNWGDINTGDRAAAARYIEARLSKLANHIVFNPQTTEWQLSYDGRNNEPVTLPVKFPLVLAQGVEGIAVGLSTKIMPHNFIELCEASIALLNGKKTNIMPDFPTGGMADFSNYQAGLRGGKVRVRARIEEKDKKTLLIKDIPYGSTTSSVIDSIIKANDSGKLKIKKVVDNTAKDVEIEIIIPTGVSPDIMIDALYAFTDCEVSISPNCCIIIDEKPIFINVNDVLKMSTDNTVVLLRRELEIRKGELLEKILFSSLEKIFIENRIYRDIEECETWESVLETIDKGLDPFKPDFYREITQDDIVRLTEIKIKRISKFDTFKADELMKRLTEELSQVEHHLANLIEYAIAYFQELISKFGKGKERKTEISTFDTIEAKFVAANNTKLYVNRKEGFMGTGLKKDEFVCECSDIDDIIVFRKDGKMVVSRIQDKVFVGKNIIHIGVFKKNDERKVYNMVYLNGLNGRTMIKRFQVLSITRDKEYPLVKGNNKSRVAYFSANDNGEAETITVSLTSSANARVRVFDYDFADIDIKGRSAGGNILTKHSVRKIEFKAAGVSTLSGLDVWYDDIVGRLNRDDRGKYLGEFNGDDLILVLYNDGCYELTSFELTNRYDNKNIIHINKFDPNKILNVIHYDGSSKVHYVKRFVIDYIKVGKKYSFIPEEKGSKLITVSLHPSPKIELTFKKGSRDPKEVMNIEMNDFIDVKGWKAIGNKLTSHKVVKVQIHEPEIEEKIEEPTNGGDEGGSDLNPSEKVIVAKTPKQKEEEEKQAEKKGLNIGSVIQLNIKKDKEKKKGDDDQLGLF